MNPSQQDVINTMVTLNADLLQSMRTDNLSEFVRTLSSVERLARFTREKLISRAVVDPTDTEDDEL